MVKKGFVRFKKIGFLALVSCLFFPCHWALSEKNSSLEVRIISLMPDFYDFWEKAKDLALEKKIDLWNSIFENKYSDFYRQAIYTGVEGEELSRMKTRKLSDFLGSLKDKDVQKMKDKEAEVKELVFQAVEDLRKIMPEEGRPTSHYLLPSLNTSSGAARPYQGDMVVYYGLEILSSFKDPADIKAVIAHETFHVSQFRHMAPAVFQKYGEKANFSSFLFGEGPLLFGFMEGLAVFVTEKVYPGVMRPGIIEGNVPLYEKNFIQYTKEILKDLDHFTFEKYKRYFWDPNDDPTIPDKFGYWLGYKVVQSLSKNHTLEEMVKWPPDKAKQMMMEEIKNLLAL